MRLNPFEVLGAFKDTFFNSGTLNCVKLSKIEGLGMPQPQILS